MNARRSCTSISLSLAVALGGCGLSARHARDSVDRERQERARALEVERRALAPFQRAKAAREAARSSSEHSAERHDRELEARLWLDVAIAEAERQVSSETRLEEERALLELDARVVALESEQRALARENELYAARALARQEAERALARAAKRRDLRVRIPRDEATRAAEALLGRAELIAIALHSFGHEGAALSRLEEKLGETRALVAKDPEASLARADETLFFALSLLAPLREGEDAPSEEEKAALLEELATAGFKTSRGDRGLVASIEPAFAGNGARPETPRLLERLCAIAKGHPHGPVQLSVRAKDAAQGEKRAALVRERLAREECRGERFAVARATGPDDSLDASFLAY